MAAYRTRDARGASSTNDCRDPAIGAIDPWAQDLVDRVGSYTGKMADQKIGLAGGGAGKAQRDDRLGAIDHPHSAPRAQSKPAVADIPVTAGLIRGLPGCEVFGDPGLAAFIRERIQELARGAYVAQGRRAFESTLRAAALHESGHAVVYSALGVPLTRLAVRRRQGHWVGRTSTAAGPWRCDADSAPLADLDCATGLMAGVVSELLEWRKTLRAREIVELLAGITEAAP
jgi:hypothetical protein